MDTFAIKNGFARAGLNLKLVKEPFIERWLTRWDYRNKLARPWLFEKRVRQLEEEAPDFAIDVESGRNPHGKDDVFEIRYRPLTECVVVEADKSTKRLLLLVETELGKDQLVCGHDERGYFASTLREGACGLRGAVEQLKPPQVRKAEARGEKVKRQGEWFLYLSPAIYRYQVWKSSEMNGCSGTGAVNRTSLMRWLVT